MGVNKVGKIKEDIIALLLYDFFLSLFVEFINKDVCQVKVALFVYVRTQNDLIGLLVTIK